jgi:hypothetical protein
MLPTKFRQRKEVIALTYIISFLVAITAGVACHYIIKWLDSNDKGNK